MTAFRCWDCGRAVSSAAWEARCVSCRVAFMRGTPLPAGNIVLTFNPPQPLDGYRKIVTPPRGQPARPEDAFPVSCCEGIPAPTKEPGDE